MREMTLDDALHVVRRMRDLDRRCVKALSGGISDEAFAIERFRTDGPAWALDGPAGPVAICGLSLATPWAAVMWLICTPEMAQHSWGKLLRLARTVIANVTCRTHPEYRHRIEAYTLDGWEGAHALVRRLGFEHEGVRRRAGSGGENIHCWTITGEPR